MLNYLKQLGARVVALVKTNTARVAAVASVAIVFVLGQVGVNVSSASVLKVLAVVLPLLGLGEVAQRASNKQLAAVAKAKVGARKSAK